MNIKQIFCRHKYSVLGTIHCTYIDDKKIDCDVNFLECSLCKKRTVLMMDDFYYRKSFLHLIKLWKKNQIEINFKSFKKKKGIR